jgi:hypothetical protein
MQITEQTETEVKFKVPENIKAGRYHLMVLTADKKSFIEQPVVFTVELSSVEMSNRHTCPTDA